MKIFEKYEINMLPLGMMLFITIFAVVANGRTLLSQGIANDKNLITTILFLLFWIVAIVLIFKGKDAIGLSAIKFYMAATFFAGVVGLVLELNPSIEGTWFTASQILFLSPLYGLKYIYNSNLMVSIVAIIVPNLIIFGTNRIEKK